MYAPHRRALRLVRVIALLAIALPAITIGVPARAAATNFYANVLTDAFSVSVTDCAVQTNTDCTLREAIAAANANAGTDTVTLVNGATYHLTIGPTGSDDNTTGDLNILQGTSIVVAASGAATVDASGMTPTRDRVLTVTGSPVGITNVTLTGGSAATGGGIVNSGTVNLTNSVVSSNTATGTDPSSQGGGGILNTSGGQLTLFNTSLHDNTTTGAGGAIFNVGATSQTTLTMSTLTNNQADDGGGVRNVSGTTQVTDSTIASNVVTHVHAGFGNGGGISNDGTVMLTRATVSSNTVQNDAAAGGVGNGHGSVTLDASMIGGNTAGFGGGIQNFFSDGTIGMTNTTVSANHATAGNGGGVRNFGAFTATNSTFSGNTAAGVGGGITFVGTVTLTNVTVAANSTGINNSGGALTLKNALIGGNTNGDCTGIIVSGDYNLASDATCSSFVQPHDRRSVAPLLALLGSYGGQTQTHALLPGSPAIDAGDDVTCTATAGGLDQRGISRFASGTHCDIGAFESRGFTQMLSSGNSQTTDVTASFSNPVIITVASAHSEPVAGGQVTVTGPASGAGIQGVSVTGVIVGTTASISATANTTAGAYDLTASAAGTTNISFSLTNRPLLLAITPGSGGNIGGNPVILIGVGLGTPANTQVLLDGVSALPAGNVVSVTATQIIYVAPAHLPGGVTVKVMTNGVTSAGKVYTYGIVNVLPSPEPAAPGGSGVQSLPGPRPAAPAGAPPAPLPAARP